MTKYEFTVTIGASALNLAAQAFLGTVNVAYPAGWIAAYGTGTLRAAKLSFQMLEGGSGRGFVGNSSVTAAGANADYELAAASATAPGGFASVESHTDANIVDLAQYWIHGSNSGDKALVSFQTV